MSGQGCVAASFPAFLFCEGFYFDIMKKYEYKESFMHYYAKEVVYNWLINAEKEADYCKFAQFEWRKNYGVHKELKFYKTSDPYYFEFPLGNKGEIFFVPDITVFHKGTPGFIIEIVHTHFIEKGKIEKMINFFMGHTLTIYEIDAFYLMNMRTDVIPEKLELLNIYEI